MSLIQTHKSSFDLLEHTEMPGRTFAPGADIIEEGSNAKEMFVVRKGHVAIKVHGETVEEIGPGGIFGEMALIDHEHRSASASAIDDCEVVPIDERLFVVLVQDTPFFALDVMRTLARRIRAMNERL